MREPGVIKRTERSEDDTYNPNKLAENPEPALVILFARLPQIVNMEVLDLEFVLVERHSLFSLEIRDIAHLPQRTRCPYDAFLRQVLSPVSHVPELDLVQPPRGFLAVAGNEGEGGTILEEGQSPMDLLGGEGKLGGDALGDGGGGHG